MARNPDGPRITFLRPSSPGDKCILAAKIMDCFCTIALYGSILFWWAYKRRILRGAVVNDSLNGCQSRAVGFPEASFGDSH